MKVKSLVSGLLAGLLGVSTSSNAAVITALYESTIDLSGIGGASNADFIVEYSFNTNEVDTSGSSNIGRYFNVSGNAAIGSDTLTFAQGEIRIENDISGNDLYEFSLSTFQNITGTVLGTELLDIRFQLFDLDGTIFSDDSLPSDFAFTSGIDTGWRFIRNINNPSGFFTAQSFGNVNDGQFFTLTASSAVPIPAAAWLFGSALLGLVAAKRKGAAA